MILLRRGFKNMDSCLSGEQERKQNLYKCTFRCELENSSITKQIIGYET